MLSTSSPFPSVTGGIPTTSKSNCAPSFRRRARFLCGDSDHSCPTEYSNELGAFEFVHQFVWNGTFPCCFCRQQLPSRTHDEQVRTFRCRCINPDLVLRSSEQDGASVYPKASICMRVKRDRRTSRPFADWARPAEVEMTASWPRCTPSKTPIAGPRNFDKLETVFEGFPSGITNDEWRMTNEIQNDK